MYRCFVTYLFNRQSACSCLSRLYHALSEFFNRCKTLPVCKKKISALYSGQSIAAEWYVAHSGYSPSLAYFHNLSFDHKKKSLNSIRLLADIGMLFNKRLLRLIDNHIYLLRPSQGVIFTLFFYDDAVIITHGYSKKNAQLSKREKSCAIKARIDYIKRIKDGTYYA